MQNLKFLGNYDVIHPVTGDRRDSEIATSTLRKRRGIKSIILCFCSYTPVTSVTLVTDPAFSLFSRIISHHFGGGCTRNYFQVLSSIAGNSGGKFRLRVFPADRPADAQQASS